MMMASVMCGKMMVMMATMTNVYKGISFISLKKKMNGLRVA